jgi:hypothetical protein
MAESERTLVFVKPKNEDIAYTAFNYLNFLLSGDGRFFQKFGLTWELNCVPETLIATHYSHLRVIDEQVFRATIEAYKTVRRQLGNTDPQKAEDWTVRGRFRRDSCEDAFREKRYLNNVMHSSANLFASNRESGLWLPFLQNRL